MKKGNAAISVLIMVLIIMFVAQPKENISATLSGILLWANTLLPALFPFFFFTRLLTQFGFIEHVSKYLQPITKKLFNTPGISAYVYLMSILSGYPVGAKLTSDLYNDNIISKEDAFRITTFTSTSGPLFVVGSVGVGMFFDTKMGVIILISHLVGAIFNGVLYRNYTPNEAKSKKRRRYFKNKKTTGLINEASQNNNLTHVKSLSINRQQKTCSNLNHNTATRLIKERIYKVFAVKTMALQTNSRTFKTTILKNLSNENVITTHTNKSINKNSDRLQLQKNSAPKTKQGENLLEKTMFSSIVSILIVGGYVSLFFLIITMLNNYNILYPLNYFLGEFFTLVKVPAEAALPLINGIIEITKGCLDLSLSGVNKFYATIFATAIITFGGLSTHMQALTFLRNFKIKISFYLTQKLTHTIISVIISIIICLIVFK